MFKIERKIVEFVERNVNILFILAITGLAIAVRYAGRDFVSGDMTWFLLGWFQKIADNGGIHSLKNQVGDYNILYQTIVALFKYIGDKSIYYYKILSIFFDFCMAISAAIFACELSKKEKNDKVFFITFAAVIMLPTVILNSAYWGQCDSIYTTFIILTLLYLYKGKYHSAFVFLGIAFAFKMQTIFIFPFIICFYIYKKPGSYTCENSPCFICRASVFIFFCILSLLWRFYVRLLHRYFTVILQFSFFAPLCTVITAVPFRIPFTTPLEFTVAILRSEERKRIFSSL